jgi:translation initiation factor 5B
MVGRQVNEGDYLYSDIPLDQINTLLEKYDKYLTENERNYLKKLLRFKMGLSSSIEYP